MRAALLVFVLGLAASSCVRGEPPLSLTGAAVDDAPLELVLSKYPSGEPHALSSDRGSVVLLDIWATWCEPCKEALPTYEQLAKHYGARGLKVYAVNVDDDPKDIEAFLRDVRVNVPILVDRNAARVEQKLKVRVMPSTFLLDRKGRLRFTHEGFSEDFLMKYQTQIEQLLSE